MKRLLAVGNESLHANINDNNVKSSKHLHINMCLLWTHYTRTETLMNTPGTSATVIRRVDANQEGLELNSTHQLLVYANNVKFIA
jgi:hypothetical protein